MQGACPSVVSRIRRLDGKPPLEQRPREAASRRPSLPSLQPLEVRATSSPVPAGLWFHRNPNLAKPLSRVAIPSMICAFLFS